MVGPIVAGLVIGFGLGSAHPAQAAEAQAATVQANRERAAIVDLLDRSVTTGDVEAISAARDATRRLLDLTPTEEERDTLRYLLAYANWRLLGANPPPDGSERDALADEAESMLAASLAGGDMNVEALALLGAVYGMKIGSSTWRGMPLGRRAARAFDTARAIDERNPRFLLMKGLDVYHRPAMFGGGLERAERWFRAALGFFQAQPGDAPWPNWGLLDAHAWLGRTLARLGAVDGAREQYETVLQLEPDHAFVRDFLLPRLESRSP